MNQKHYLLKGTFLLTTAGLLTRLAGFFYKIFLSRTIGASEIGLFQMTMPVFLFCSAACSGGIQTAISRFTAESFAQNDRKSAHRLLACGLLLSGSLSILCAILLCLFAPQIAEYFLLEERCTLLLRIVAVSLPFSVIHSCLSGYFIGRKNVSLSAASQLIEQLLRIGSVFFFYVIFKKNGRTPDAAVMALGQLAGELAAALFCIGCLFCRPVHTSFPDTLFPHRSDFRRMCSVSAPLGLNRMLTCVLQGIEAALLPQMLIRFGHDSSDALAVYGTLTGMALPLILFPTAITGSLGTLLLPAISESHALHQDRKIADTTRASFFASLLLGYFFLILFRFCGNTVGTFLFHSETAGSLIRSLALICPFLYVNTTLYSILHALGKTTVLTVGNVFCFAVRLLFVVLFVPEHGINGYLTGTIVSQGLMTLICLTALRQYLFPSQQKKNSPDTGFSLRQRLCH